MKAGLPAEALRVGGPPSPLLGLRWMKDSIAQLVEHYTFNVRVLGSSPSGITKNHSSRVVSSFLDPPAAKTAATKSI